ncbi:conserved protein of unknown function [Nitrospira japonica]|uniref:DUF928 domain-containing protein n=2 Tax=Nitrospira japonica TaxID=1325564 RepID=A0A1W1I7W3_9BACT|nr:conserved protein of unknown function [Nitrospira japonica]
MNATHPHAFLRTRAARSSGTVLMGVMLATISVIGSDMPPGFAEQVTTQANGTSRDQIPLYQPPKKFTPRARVGGELRGTEGMDPEVQALVPDHVGFTSSQTPVLNWYLSKPTPHEVRFTLIDNQSVRPVYEAPIPTPKQPGIFSIAIKDLGLALDPNIQYRWYVSVVRDPSSPSKDIVGGGVIERCEMSDCLITFDAKITCSVQTVTDNARAGFWYDAMGCLCTLIDANPTDASLRRLRAGLLKQVGLNGVAEWDLRSVQTQQR